MRLIVVQSGSRVIPSRYSSLSLNTSYLALEDGSPIFRQVISHLTYYFSNLSYYGTFTLYGLSFQTNYNLILILSKERTYQMV